MEKGPEYAKGRRHGKVQFRMETSESIPFAWFRLDLNRKL